MMRRRSSPAAAVIRPSTEPRAERLPHRSVLRLISEIHLQKTPFVLNSYAFVLFPMSVPSLSWYIDRFM
jgi:hypothetical protein